MTTSFFEQRTFDNQRRGAAINFDMRNSRRSSARLPDEIWSNWKRGRKLADDVEEMEYLKLIEEQLLVVIRPTH